MAVLIRSLFILILVLLSAELNYCMEVDLCVPVRVDHQQSGKHPSRREEKINDRVMMFRISAFRQEFYLNLTHDSNFLAPSIASESGSSPHSPASSELRRCFYSGHVNADRDSYVALSLCKGLRGAFSYRGMEYFISQVGSEGSQRFTTRFERTHVIRRRGRSDSGNPSSRCGVEPGSNLNISGSLEKYRHGGGLGREGLSETVLRSLGRSRRFASIPRFVEVLVVADESMAKFHGDDLKHYLLTLLSVAARLYRHPSILNSISLVVVGFMVLGESDKGPKVSSNAALTLRNFCSWQRKINKLNDKHPEHWDTAILFTKQDLCGATTCDTLGMADVGTMCDPKRSCSVIEDDGLPSAFTTAHELGHVFNMPHDNVRACEEAFGKLKDDHMMSPTLIQINRHRPWSVCSAAIITDFLDRGHGDCLLDQPERQLSLPDILPGSSYSLPRQCELAFGAGSRPCPYMQPCSKLWCTGQARGQLVCQTRHFPWADGTSCGGGRVCYRGSCTHRNSTTHTKVDGRWGNWGGFGPCSRTCGGGVQLVRRECDHPVPEHGGKFCQGLRVRYRSCNLQPCLAHTGKTFREEQCEAFNGLSLNTNRLSSSVVWVPKFSGIAPKDSCKLICRANGTGYFYILAPKVVDGTPCSPDTSAVCVQGRCVKAGCDGRISSSKMFDKCGVCGGDNRSCRRITGMFTRPIHGYNLVVQLPVGASNIDIRQRGYRGLANDDNYLAVRDGRGRYLLNGNYVVSAAEKDLLVRGSLLRYSGTSSSLETLRSTRPLVEALTVEVLSVGKMTPPRIRYSFYLEKSKEERSKEERSKEERSKEEKSKEERSKVEKSKEERSKERSKEEKSKEEKSKEEKSKERSKEEKSKEERSKEERSKEERSKEEKSKEEKSKEEKSKERSKEEKSKEERSKEERSKEERSKEERSKEEKSKEERSKEEKSKEERSKEEKSREEKSKEERSKEERRKEEKSKEEKSHNSILMDSNQVEGKKRGMDRREVGRWVAGGWEACSVSCGSGMQRRVVQCQGPDRGAASDCELPQRPPASRECGDPCPLWEAGPWSHCSKTCGRGFKRRLLRCVTQTRLNLPREHCSGKRKPQELDLCSLRAC